MRSSARRILAAALLLLPAATVAAQDWAQTRLQASPRHHEYVSIRSGSRNLQAFVVYPEIKQKAPVIVLIHEIFGLSDWAKEMADELAAAGYIVIAPDLVTGLVHGDGDQKASQEATIKAVTTLPAEQVTADLDAVADFGKKIPAASGKLFVAGFCWGGGKSFAFAAHRHDLSAAFVFYGSGPDSEALSSITAPVYGFYAGNDARIGATLPATTEAMKAAGKTFEPVTYEGAGHGFMRAGEDPAGTPENKKARDEAFARLTKLLKQSASTAAISTPHTTVTSRTTAHAPACHDEASISM